jgi:predicted GTPase
VTGVGGVIRAVRDVFGGGGTDSVHYETAPPDPATLQLLEQIKSSSIEFQKRMDVALAALSERASTERAQAAHELEADFQAKVSEMRERQADPRRFVEIERGLFETFVQGLRRQFGPGAGPDAAVTVAATNQVMVAVIGRVASGKSTLINALLDRNACPTGGE